MPGPSSLLLLTKSDTALPVKADNPLLYFDAAHPNGEGAAAPAGGSTVQMWSDLSGYEFHMLQGLSSRRPVYLTSGPGMDFDGVDDFLSAAAQAAFETPYLSVEVRVTPDSFAAAGTYRSMMSKQNAWDFALVGGLPEFYLVVTPDAGGANVERNARSATPLVAGQTYRLRGTFDGTTTRLYVDGTLVQSNAGAAAKATVSGTGTLYLGSYNGTSEFFDGKIHEAHLYNYAFAPPSTSVTGAGAITAPTALLSGTGTVTVTAAGSLTAAQAALSGAAQVATGGAGALTAAPATLTAAGQVRVTATGALAAAPATLAGTGAVRTAGAGALTAAPATVAGSGATRTTGTGALTAAPATLFGDAAVTAPEINNLVGPAAELSGTGAVKLTGTGSLVAPPAQVAGAGATSLAGTGALTAAPATLTGAGGVFEPAQVPASRTYLIVAETRIHAVPADDRSYAVARDSRTHGVPAESRVYAVQADVRETALT